MFSLLVVWRDSSSSIQSPLWLAGSYCHAIVSFFAIMYNKEIADETNLRLRITINEVPKPIGQIARSGEDREHHVWIIDNALILRVRTDGQDETDLVREKQLWDLLNY